MLLLDGSTKIELPVKNVLLRMGEDFFFYYYYYLYKVLETLN